MFLLNKQHVCSAIQPKRGAFIGKTSGNGHEPMDLRTSWARSDEDLAMTHTAEKLPAAIRERSNETRRSLISRLACSSTSTDQTLQTTLHFW